MPIYYQNQSTVWFLSGENITFNGHSIGTIDGNGQIWYDLVKGISNYPSAFSLFYSSHYADIRV
jgi:galacturan 1,4-alpha-galacturonidase